MNFFAALYVKTAGVDMLKNVLFLVLFILVTASAAFSRADTERNRIERDSAKAKVAGLEADSSFLQYLLPAARPCFSVALFAQYRFSPEVHLAWLEPLSGRESQTEREKA